MTDAATTSTARTWGLVHPGAMGASVGAALTSAGATVCWCPDGRSDATAERARVDGLTAIESLRELAASSGAIISVCPPHAAVAQAIAVAEAGFSGLYVDANAVAPATAIEVAQIITSAGGSAVDGGIIGPPARRPGTTRLYLSGDRATEAAAAFAGSMLEANVVSHEIGAASALKVAYAAWTKASAALLLNIRAFAEVEGVSDALLAEWERSQPGVKERSELSAAFSAPKAWRFAGEMRELASSFAEAGLPDGALTGAAEVYDRLTAEKDCPDVDIGRVVRALLNADS